MTIEKFHETFWSNKSFWLNDHMYYHQQPSEKRSYWNEKEDGKFDPHYSMNNFSRKSGREFTPQDIEKIYNSVDFKKYAGKKFIIQDYIFYAYSSGEYTDKHHKDEIACGHSFYMDYHGFRLKVLDFEEKKYFKEYGGKPNNGYSKGVEGLDIMFDLLKDNPDVELIPYELEELTGPIGFKITSIRGLTPSAYFQKKHPTYEWEGAAEKIGEIDLDHFIKMDIKDGVYKPTSSIMDKLLNYDNQDLLKTKIKKFKDFGVHTIKFLNNSNWDVSKFYNLEGVEVKASKSVLSRYPEMRNYSTDEKAKSEIIAAEKAAEEAYQKSIYDDTYTLMRHGKVVLENVRSYDITNYFENKEEQDFDLFVIEAAKKCFEAAPELDKIFFGRYGIYSYTEMSGERFSDFENVERINKDKDIILPKRLVTLINSGAIDTPYIDKDDKTLTFDRGANYLGVEKNSEGKLSIINEDGDQGI